MDKEAPAAFGARELHMVVEDWCGSEVLDSRVAVRAGGRSVRLVQPGRRRRVARHGVLGTNEGRGGLAEAER
mgnify:CR=1